MKCLSFILFLFLTFGVYAKADITFSESKWHFRTIPDTTPVKNELTVQNNGDNRVTISIIPTCDCLYVDPGEFKLEPGGEITVTLTFDPEGYEGDIQMRYIVRTDSRDLPRALFLVEGRVETHGSSAISSGRYESEEEDTFLPGTNEVSKTKTIDAYYYYTSGCKECAKFLDRTVPRIAKKLQLSIKIHEKNILDPTVYEELMVSLKDARVEMKRVPLLIINGNVLQGDEEINEKFENLLRATAYGALDEAFCYRKQPVQSIDEKAVGSDTTVTEKDKIVQQLGILSVITAGLLDGINPCAFTTLIFLLSTLAIAGRQRYEIFIIGVFYTISVFASYFCIGIGLFSALMKAESFPVVATIIQWVLVGVLFLFAGLNLYDFILIKRGRIKDIKLQLPDFLKMKIHSSIRIRSRSAALIVSTLVLGFFVSLFELACTGQIYFPTIAYMVKIRQSASSYLLLGLYNIGFIAPLIGIFTLAYIGISSQKLIRIFKQQVGKVKLATAVLFVVLAALMIHIIMR